MLNLRKFILGLLTTTALVSCGKSIESLPLQLNAKGKTSIAYNLPLGIFRVEVTSDGKGTQPTTIAAEAVEILPDADARYYATLASSAFASDDFKIVTGPGGLLDGANATTDDRTPAIIGKIIEVAKEAAKLVAQGVGPEVTATEPFSLSLAFDPMNQVSVQSAAVALAGQGLALTVKDLSGDDIHVSGTLPLEAPICENSLCYRLMTPVQVTIKNGAAGPYPGFERSFLALVPDPRTTLGVDVTRAVCAEKITELDFNSGILVSTRIKKPSEIEGCLQVPVDALRAIASIPGEILAFRQTNLEAETAFLNALTTNAQSQASFAQVLADQAAAEQSSN